MKKIVIASFLVTVIFLIGCGSYGGTSTPATPVQAQPPAATPAPAQQQAATSAPTGKVNQVSIKGFAFNPSSITIKKGDSITWTNEDSVPHTVTGAGFDSRALIPGKSYSYTFNDAGSYDYKCSIHPTMKATVVVQPR